MPEFLTPEEAVAHVAAQCIGKYGTQSDLAKRAGVSVVMINHIIHRRRALCPRVARAAGLIPGFQVQQVGTADAPGSKLAGGSQRSPAFLPVERSVSSEVQDAQK